MAEQADMKSRRRVIKEGFLQKKTSLLKQWRSRFVVLNRQLLCIFKKEDDEKRGRTADGRIFLMDIEKIDKFETKKRKHCFNLIVEGKPFFSFSCSSEIDRTTWVLAIQAAKENELKAEETDPVRRKSTKLTGGLKRITIPREKGQGLGCTIKNVGGVIFVNRILEDGPVSTSGILRPGIVCSFNLQSLFSSRFMQRDNSEIRIASISMRSSEMLIWCYFLVVCLYEKHLTFTKLINVGGRFSASN